MKPNASAYNPDPEYIKELIRDSGLTIKVACGRCNVPYSTMMDYLSDSHPSKMPYAVQFCLQSLATDR